MKSISTLLALSLPLFFFSCTTTKYTYYEHEFTEPVPTYKREKVELDYSIQDFVLTYKVQNNTDSLYLVDWTKSVFIINDKTYHFMDPIILSGSFDGVVVPRTLDPNIDVIGDVKIRGQKRSEATTIPPKLSVTRGVSLYPIIRSQGITIDTIDLDLRIQSHLVITSLDEEEILVKKIDTRVNSSTHTGARKRASFDRPNMYGYGVKAYTTPDPAGNIFMAALTGFIVFWLSNIDSD